MSIASILGGKKKKKKGLRKPKLKKFPPMPSSTNIVVLNTYAKKCAEITKENAHKLAEYNAKVKVRTEAKARVKKLKEDIKKMKSGGKG
jgi:hypothetical protein